MLMLNKDIHWDMIMRKIPTRKNTDQWVADTTNHFL